ncbi:MAG: hypothetical protein NW206_13175 [Hyphomonadaceae bacterium]|nr:hypothetical protein [Hyphomonadaceae bacterium]
MFAGMFTGWGVNEWVAASSAALALASFVLNWAVVSRQTKLQFESLKAQMDADVMDWAHETIDLVSEASALARGRGAIYQADEFGRRALEVAAKLSSAADRGRLFFPNEAPTQHGAEKEAAFQGIRPPVLDAVVFAHVQLDRTRQENGGPDEAACDYLIRCRRLLVSELQNAIDPRRRGAMLEQLAEGRMDDKKSSFRVAAELGEALEARYPGTLLTRRDEAWVQARESQARRRR